MARDEKKILSKAGAALAASMALAGCNDEAAQLCNLQRGFLSDEKAASDETVIARCIEGIPFRNKDKTRLSDSDCLILHRETVRSLQSEVDKCSAKGK